MATVQDSSRPGAIVLARTPPFRLADVEVRPATRQIVRGTESETLEPRIMQLLVALAHAKGEIVSRDDLIERCWDGRIVGDNAIHRAVSRLRELALGFAGGAFQIETITKVGYRLLLNPEAAPVARSGVAPPPEPARRTARRSTPTRSGAWPRRDPPCGKPAPASATRPPRAS